MLPRLSNREDFPRWTTSPPSWGKQGIPAYVFFPSAALCIDFPSGFSPTSDVPRCLLDSRILFRCKLSHDDREKSCLVLCYGSFMLQWRKAAIVGSASSAWWKTKERPVRGLQLECCFEVHEPTWVSLDFHLSRTELPYT